VPFASRKNVSPIGSRKASFDGASSSHTAQPIFTNHLSVSAASPTGWNRRILRSFELFNLSVPFLKLLKCATARTSHAKVIVKNRHEYWSLTFLLKRFGDDLTGDPNAPAGGLGPPIPPLYSCKNLRIVWKRPTRRFLWFNPDFTAKRAVPPHLQKPTKAHLFKVKNSNQRVRLKMQNQSHRPCSWGKHRTTDP